MGPIVEYQDMLENKPFDDTLRMLMATGARFRRMIQYVLRDEAWGGHTELYRYSKGVRIYIGGQTGHSGLGATGI